MLGADEAGEIETEPPNEQVAPHAGAVISIPFELYPSGPVSCGHQSRARIK